MLPPCKRFRMTLPQSDVTAEAIIPARLCKKSAARHWMWVQPTLRTWRDEEGSPSTFKIKENSTAAHILSVTSEPIHRTIPLLVARIVCHKDQIHEMQDHLEKLPVERFEAIEEQDESLAYPNGLKRWIGLDVAYETTWKELKHMMTDKYYLRNEELALLCPIMVTPEYKKSERYIWGLTNDIQGNATSSKPTKIQESIRMAHDLMDQVVRSKAAKGAAGRQEK
ncbi:hypothetical protein Tco_0847888 [Tanacetum coccineum]